MDIEKKFSECGPYKIEKQIGKGAFGKVKLALLGEQRYAIKMFNVQSCQQRNMRSFTNEVTILQQISHPNLVRMVSYDAMPYVKKNGQQEERICVVLEYCAGGELYEYLAQTGKFKEDVARFYFKQLLSALQYLHGQGLTHRDIKPENILFDGDFNLRLTDLGFTTFVGKHGSGLLETKLGTPGYQAPEIIANQTYNGQSIDLFAAAIILFIMVTGFPPFKEASPKDQLYRCICTNRYEELWAHYSKRLDTSNQFSSEFKSLISAMLAFDPTQRLTMSEIVVHPWLQGPTATIEQLNLEFNCRKNKIESQKIKEKLQMQAKKQALNKPKQGPLHAGIGAFRSSGTHPEFALIDQKYHLNDKERVLREQNADSLKPGDYLTYFDPDYLLRFLLDRQIDYCNEILKVYDEKYKFDFRILTSNEPPTTLSIQFFRVDDEQIFVQFQKKEGSTYEFYKKIGQIEEIINKLGNSISEPQQKNE